MYPLGAQGEMESCVKVCVSECIAAGRGSVQLSSPDLDGEKEHVSSAESGERISTDSSTCACTRHGGRTEGASGTVAHAQTGVGGLSRVCCCTASTDIPACSE
jgi:hypothetical protein